MSRPFVTVFFVGVLVAGCSSPLALPDPTDPGVQAEEGRLAVLLETTDDIWVPQPRRCSVRILGQEGATFYVWARCEGPDDLSDGESERPGQSGPLRIDEDQVSQPRDGGLFSDDVEEMFPAHLAEAIFDRDPRLFP